MYLSAAATDSLDHYRIANPLSFFLQCLVWLVSSVVSHNNRDSSRRHNFLWRTANNKQKIQHQQNYTQELALQQLLTAFSINTGLAHGSATRHRHSSTWPHYTSVEATPLASGPTTSRFQAGPPGLQGAARCNCSISCRLLPASLSRRQFHAGHRRLRSADTCCVPQTNTRLGDWSFAAAGPRLWNSLPARIRQPDNDVGEFRRQLKSFLVNWRRGA